MTILVQAPNVRLETSDFAFLYDVSGDQTIVMQLNERTYYPMSRESAEELAKRMEAAREQMLQIMEQAKANMTAEERAQMEKYMESRGMGALTEPPKMSLEISGRRDSFHGIECQWVEMLKNGQPLSEMCIANAADLGMDASEREAVNRMADLLLSMGNAISQASLERSPDGIPLAMNDFQENHRLRLHDWTSESLDAALFRVPDDFRMISISGGG